MGHARINTYAYADGKTFRQVICDTCVVIVATDIPRDNLKTAQELAELHNMNHTQHDAAHSMLTKDLETAAKSVRNLVAYYEGRMEGAIGVHAHIATDVWHKRMKKADQVADEIYKLTHQFISDTTDEDF